MELEGVSLLFGGGCSGTGHRGEKTGWARAELGMCVRERGRLCGQVTRGTAQDQPQGGSSRAGDAGLSHRPRRRWLQLVGTSGRPGSKCSGVSMETEQHRTKQGLGMAGVASAWCGRGASSDLPPGSPTTGQLTGRRAHPLTALASSGPKGWRPGPPLGERGGWEPFLRLWPFLPGICRTLQHNTRPGRDWWGAQWHRGSDRLAPCSPRWSQPLPRLPPPPPPPGQVGSQLLPWGGGGAVVIPPPPPGFPLSGLALQAGQRGWRGELLLNLGSLPPPPPGWDLCLRREGQGRWGGEGGEVSWGAGQELPT